jgi:hypothetical protein
MRKSSLLYLCLATFVTCALPTFAQYSSCYTSSPQDLGTTTEQTDQLNLCQSGSCDGNGDIPLECKSGAVNKKIKKFTLSGSFGLAEKEAAVSAFQLVKGWESEDEIVNESSQTATLKDFCLCKCFAILDDIKKQKVQRICTSPSGGPPTVQWEATLVTHDLYLGDCIPKCTPPTPCKKNCG